MRKSLLVFAAALWLGGVVFAPGAVAQTSTDNADLDKRLQRLEEQMVDLSAHLGTIESMAQNGGIAASPNAGQLPSAGPSGGGDLENTVRALSAQMNDILRRLQQLEQRRSGSLPPSQAPAGGAGRNYAGSPQPSVGDRPSTEPVEEGTGFSVGGNEPPAGGFGATIEPGREQPQPTQRKSSGLGGYPDSGSAQSANPNGPSAAAPIQTADRSSPRAQASYQQAYNVLVQRDYRAAADQFEQFVASYSNDPLAGQAYFWLGEASFVNGEYRKAADSFLKSSTNYPQNEKAAEALLKLGISLKRLGENKAACSSFAELARRYPGARPVLQRAELEKSRAQC